MFRTNRYVLFVDDDPDDLEILQTCCRELQVSERARFVQSGNALFRFLSAIREADNFPSLIVLDMNMPEMNGEEVLLLLKRNARFTHIPVVFYSTGHGDYSNYLALGAEAFYKKPNNYQQVVESIQTFFQRLAKNITSG